MDASVTPAGQLILRVERNELEAVVNAIQAGLMLCEAIGSQREGGDSKDAEVLEALRDAIQSAADRAAGDAP